jgi:hypothetical protein
VFVCPGGALVGCDPFIASVQRGDVLPDRIGLTCGAGLPAHQLERTDEVRKPRHPNPCQPRTE